MKRILWQSGADFACHVYKELPAKRKVVELNGFDSAEKAQAEVAAAIKAYAAKK